MKFFAIASAIASMAVMIPAITAIPQPTTTEVAHISLNQTLETNNALELGARAACDGNTDPNQIYCDTVNNRASPGACDKIINKLSNLTPDTKYTKAECDWDQYGNRCCISWNTGATQGAGIRGAELARAAMRIRDKCGAGGVPISGAHRSLNVQGIFDIRSDGR
ncbi:hypothetical protein JR316_0006803 [Psilocybe cubensis]|uniref:Uncharacterized protein n=1 Tax=Psilocybe cubensis TaxID=181762 RepID=A0ACB8GWT9_PSICU|nr:hypothetical protein JR316_0006803 [Psilocybe cubensis]KAH9480205.1 hypothetical protein JR316_0006803 [Psilocybe cubensis]